MEDRVAAMAAGRGSDGMGNNRETGVLAVLLQSSQMPETTGEGVAVEISISFRKVVEEGEPC